MGMGVGPVGRPESAPDATTGRCLKTGTETLRALRLLGVTPDGLSVEALATELDRSKATARYLLNTLCQEGFAYRDRVSAVYRLAAVPPWGGRWGRSTDGVEVPDSLADALSELYWRTRQRSYLAHVEGDSTVILDARGHQGLARIPGLREHISAREAHALAVTKALAASSPDMEEMLRHESDLSSFTGATISDAEDLEWELARVRRDGFALDREEYAEGFCCIAAPIFNPAGDVAASLGLSVLARRFAVDYVDLINQVVEVAAGASEQWRQAANDNSRIEALP